MRLFGFLSKVYKGLIKLDMYLVRSYNYDTFFSQLSCYYMSMTYKNMVKFI
jgi:hypothetical protein